MQSIWACWPNESRFSTTRNLLKGLGRLFSGCIEDQARLAHRGSVFHKRFQAIALRMCELLQSSDR